MANPNIVSVSSIHGGNAAWDLTTTMSTTLLTVTAEYLIKINYIGATNSHATNASVVTVDINGIGTSITGATIASGNASGFLCNEISVPGDDVLVVLDKPIYLLEGDVLRGGANPATVNLFISYEIINDA